MDLCPNCGQPMSDVYDKLWEESETEMLKDAASPASAAEAYRWWMVSTIWREGIRKDEALANAIGFASRAQDDTVVLSEAVPA